MPGPKRHKSAKHRLGEAGLASLMRDPRYFDGNAPGHEAMVDLVRRGFRLVFDEPEDNRGASTGRVPSRGNPPRRFSDAFLHSGTDEAGIDYLPGKEREAVGRRVLLQALDSDGASFPDGLEKELDRREQERNPNEGPRSATDEGPGCAQICTTLREVRGELDEIAESRQTIEAEIAQRKAEIEKVENTGPGEPLPGESEGAARRSQPEAVIPGSPTHGRGRDRKPRGLVFDILSLIPEAGKRIEFVRRKEILLERLKEELAALREERESVNETYDQKQKSLWKVSARARAQGCHCLGY